MKQKETALLGEQSLFAEIEVTSQDKKVPKSVIREKQVLYLQDEVETLKDQINWLEDEIEEANDTIYRLEHGLPVAWGCGREADAL
jgi:predicted  nucleic acid-binding Zn-ribbon protein